MCLQTVDEIKSALLDIGDQRVPGSDGYELNIYMLGRGGGVDFIAAILKFFNSCKLLRAWNHTLISLVLKLAHASKV